MNDEIRVIMNNLPELFEEEKSRYIPQEILADRFAFKNLSYFENLYRFSGILIHL